MSTHSHQGRAVPPEPLETYTVPSTGRAVRIRKMPTLLRAEVVRQIRRDPDFREPQPPMVSVDYGDGQVLQPHHGHPVYQELLAAYHLRFNREVSDRLRDLVIRRGLVVEDDEIDRAAVMDVRMDMAAIDMPLDEYEDRDVYLRFVVIGVEDEWSDLLRHVFERSQPAEAAVQAHIATFQPEVPGPGPVQSES